MGLGGGQGRKRKGDSYSGQQARHVQRPEPRGSCEILKAASGWEWGAGVLGGQSERAEEEACSLNIRTHLSGTVAMLGWYHCAHCTDEETEAQRDEVLGLGLQSD